MRILFRLTLLGCFAAAGVAIAVSVALDRRTTAALTSVPSTEPQQGSSAAGEDDGRPHPTSADRAADHRPPQAPGPVRQIETVPPADYAAYMGPIAAQVVPLAEKLGQVQEALRNNQQFLKDALSQLQQQPEPAAEVPVPTLLTPPTPSTVAGAIKQEIRRDEGDDSLTINIQNSEIREVLELLSQQGDLNILAGKDVSGTVSANLSRVDVLTALDAILKSTGYIARREGRFIYVGTVQEFQQMDNNSERVTTRVYRPSYVTAAELQALITPLLTPMVGEASVGAGKIAVSSPAEIGIPASTETTGGDSFAGGDVLLVRDYESVLHQIDNIVLEIDQRPLQVAIEAMILSVRLDDSNSLGVNFELLRNKSNVRLISGSPSNSLATIDVSEGGLKFGFLDSSLSMFIDALETIGDTNVIAAPRLMCLNKQRAEILIGSQLGYVSTTVTENAATQAIEFLEVGTQLRIRPFIASDGMIRMEVHPELSTGSVRVEAGFTLPDKEVTQVTSNIMCRDGCTVIIGGLIREDLGTTTSQIPWLGSMPIAGPLFRQKNETIDRREILVLLTPRIIHEPDMCFEGEQAGIDFTSRQANYADKMSPLGKRHFGRRYLRLARSAWAAGDAEAAFRYSNLSIHFDPQSIEAHNLRGDIIEAYPQFDQKIDRRLRDGLPLWQRPQHDYSRHGFPWQSPDQPPPYGSVPPTHEGPEPIPTPEVDPKLVPIN